MVGGGGWRLLLPFLYGLDKDSNELWVTNQGITRSQRMLKKEELVKDFEKKFSVEILEKAFHGLGSSFLREHNNTENCPRNLGSSTKDGFIKRDTNKYQKLLSQVRNEKH